MDQSKIKEAKTKWAQSDPGLAKVAPRHTDWGDPVEKLYTPADVSEQDYLEQLGFPGEHPFARGVYPSMYLGRPWTVRQYSGYDSPKDTNARFRYLLEQGQTGLSVAFDLPTQIGYDSDHPMSAGEVAKWECRWTPWRTWRSSSRACPWTSSPPP